MIKKQDYLIQKRMKLDPWGSKEDAHDYRYFPDPDLLPLNLDKELIENIKKNLPELPDQKKERFIKDYSLNAYEANVLAVSYTHLTLPTTDWV